MASGTISKAHYIIPSSYITSIPNATTIDVASMQLAPGLYIVNWITEWSSSFTQVAVHSIRVGGTSYTVRATGESGGGACVTRLISISATTTVTARVYQASGSTKSLSGYSFEVIKIV